MFYRNRRKFCLLLATNCVLVSVFVLLFALREPTETARALTRRPIPTPAVSPQSCAVQGLNETGLPFEVIPNIIHYTLFTDHTLQFVHFLSVLSVLRTQKPDLIYIHCDCHQL